MFRILDEDFYKDNGTLAPASNGSSCPMYIL